MNYEITKENVKRIGRTYYHNQVLWCGLSGSGIAFSCKAKYIRLSFLGDDSTAGNVTEGMARFAVYAGDNRVVDDMLQKPKQEYVVWESSSYEEVTVQIIKLSECAMSTLGIGGIDAETLDGIHPLPEKKRKIEIIGDSITCGYGIDREDPLIPFETATEDVTRAYSYKVAKALDADYSMVSYSGYGLISGYTEDDTPKKNELVSAYYEKIGFSYAKPEGTIELNQLEWDFTQFQPQIIVINLGTNDDSYCQDVKERQEEFRDLYIAFLKVVRCHNPKAFILCAVGMMGERIYPYVEEAVKHYCAQTGEKQVKALRLAEQLPEDGLVSDYHPTEVTHEKAAKRITEAILAEVQ